MSLYYVRHGQTDWNTQHLLQGRNDIPLNEKGIEQAKITSQHLKNIHIDKIYCSPLTRTMQTASIINEAKNCPIIQDERIIERCFGQMEGADIQSLQTNLWSFDKNLCSQAETMQEFFQRVYDFLDEIKEESKDKNYLIVAHGGVFLPFYDYFYTIDRKSDLMKLIPSNCSITKFDI